MFNHRKKAKQLLLQTRRRKRNLGVGRRGDEQRGKGGNLSDQRDKGKNRTDYLARGRIEGSTYYVTTHSRGRKTNAFQQKKKGKPE